MQDKFIEHIKAFKAAIENDELKINGRVLAWTYLLSITGSTDTGYFYKDFFFATIPNEPEVLERVKSIGLLPKKIHSRKNDNSNGILICYDMVGLIGYPGVGIKCPFFDFDNIDDIEKKKTIDEVLENCLKIYEITLQETPLEYEIVPSDQS